MPHSNRKQQRLAKQMHRETGIPVPQCLERVIADGHVLRAIGRHAGEAVRGTNVFFSGGGVVCSVKSRSGTRWEVYAPQGQEGKEPAWGSPDVVITSKSLSQNPESELQRVANALAGCETSSLAVGLANGADTTLMITGGTGGKVTLQGVDGRRDEWTIASLSDAADAEAMMDRVVDYLHSQRDPGESSGRYARLLAVLDEIDDEIVPLQSGGDVLRGPSSGGKGRGGPIRTGHRGRLRTRRRGRRCRGCPRFLVTWRFVDIRRTRGGAWSFSVTAPSSLLVALTRWHAITRVP